MAQAPNHGDREHAPWSPSSTGRWIKCVQSVLMDEGTPENRTNSPDSLFGEMCHECGETALNQSMSASAIRDMVTGMSWPAGFTEDDALSVIIPYVGYVESRLAELNLLYGDEAIMLVEKKQTLLRDECWGTPDCAFVWPEGIEVIDLKGGSGYMVDAALNEQLLTYASMLAKKYKRTGGLMRLTIVQPRRTDGKGAVDSWDDTMAAANAWGKHLIEIIKSARANPNTAPVAGAHCHWCKKHERCPANLAEATKMLTVIENNEAACDTSDQPARPAAPELIPVEVLSEILEKAPIITKWLKAVIAYATENPPPGWKLVEGSADRVWRPDVEIAQVLAKEKISIKTFTTEKRAGITDTVKILKLIGRPELAESLFIKPKGNPVLALASDARPAIDKSANLTTLE